MEYGICVLGNIPLRKEARDQSEIVSFLLFGEHFKIIKVNEKWINICTYFDNYSGWICAKQYKEITYEDYDNLSLNNFPVNSLKNGELINLSNNETIRIPAGSILPFYHKGKIKIRNAHYSSKVTLATRSIQDLETYSLSYLNSPYLWGGRNHLGIDCSGFSQLIFRLCGIELPRDAFQQAEVGEDVEFAEASKGDLAFFQNKDGRINHVGIVLDNNQIIHASGKVRIDHLKSKGIFNSDSQKYTHVFESLKRYF